MAELNGFVKIHRKLTRWGYYKNDVIKGVFLHLLLTANFKEMSWEGIIIKKGQLITSYASLAADLGFSTQQVRTALKKLISTGEVTSEPTNKYTLVTVVNWEDYQHSDEKSTSTLTNEQQAHIVKKLLQNISSIKNSTSKATSKSETEKLINKGFEEIEKILLTSTLTNKQQTNNKQTTNKQQQRKNDKEGKEGKEEYGASRPSLFPDENELEQRKAKLRR